MVLNPLVSLFGRLVVRSARIRGTGQTDGRNDRPRTVTLAAHARRGLIINQLRNFKLIHVHMYSRGQKKVNTSFSCNGAFYRLRFVFVSFPFYRFVSPFRFVSVFRADSTIDRWQARERCTRTTTHDHYSYESALKALACCGGL